MEDFKNTFKNIAKSISETSSGLLRSTKLNVEISNKELDLKHLYEEVGHKVSDIYKFGGSLGDPFDEMYLNIKEAEAELKALRHQINLEKGQKDCANCHKQIEKDAEFCPFCGKSQMDETKTSLSSDIAVSHTPKDTISSDAVDSAIDDEVIFNKLKKLAKEEDTPSDTDTESSVPIETVKCSACGKDNNKDEMFCRFCGRVL